MKKDEDTKKYVLDLDQVKGKPISECSPEELAEMLEPIQAMAINLQEPIRQALATKQMIEPQLASMIQFQKQLAETIERSNISNQLAKVFEATIDSRRIAESIFRTIEPSLEIMRRSVIDLNTFQSFGRLSENTYIRMALNSAQQTTENEAEIHSTAITETSFKSVSIVQTADLNLVVSTIDAKLEEKLEKQGQELSDIKSMLRELLSKGNKPLPALITDFKFDLESLKLTINGKVIEYKSPNKQTEVCKIFFSNEDSIKQKFHIEDIIEEYGESYAETLTADKIEEWNDKFYQAVRHLNDNIAKHTGLQNFIKYGNQYYQVNPEYRKLF